MSKVMMVLGVLAAAVGIALAVLGVFSAGEMQVLGFTSEVAAIFIMGGIFAIGIGGLIQAAEDHRRALGELRDLLAVPETRVSDRFTRTTATSPAEAMRSAGLTPIEPTRAPTPPPPPPPPPPLVREPEPVPETPPFAGAGGKALEAVREKADAKAAAAKPAAEKPVAETRITTRETIIAIEQAKADIESVLGAAEPSPQPAAAEEAEAAVEEMVDEAGEEQLYVMEEKVIRGRPARVLSDGTVEAETDEGWMRFENLDHLEEYLEAMSPPKD